MKLFFDQIICVHDANHTRLIVLTTGFMKFLTPNNPERSLLPRPTFLAARGVPVLDISGEIKRFLKQIFANAKTVSFGPRSL